MRNRVLEIVVFLIEHIQGDASRLSETDDLWATLEARGYSDDEISSAYSWLMRRFENTPQRFFSEFPATDVSHRILTQSERNRLTIESHGFLLKLINARVLSHEQFEIIMDRLSSADSRPAVLEEVSSLASSVVFSDVDELEAQMLLEPGEDGAVSVN
ncbi:MAG: DUF494 family protein [bacterium]